MASTHSSSSTMKADQGNILVARQPLVDVNGKIVAYELLYRNQYTSHASVLNDEQATAQLMVNILNHMGVERLLGNRKGMVNFNEELLIAKTYEILDPKRFMIEILGHTIIDEDSIEAIKAAAHRGYVLGLDDFDFDEEMIERFKPIFPYLKFIKIDVKTTPKMILKQKIPFMKSLPVQWIAEKVEDVEHYEELKAYGFKYYQGFFFAKPELIEEKDVDPHLEAVMYLMKLVRDDAEYSLIENEFKKNPDISISLLKLINSAAFGFRDRIQSIKQALALVGNRKLNQWLTLMVYARPDGAESDMVLLESAAWRGHLMESVLTSENDPHKEMAFFTGIVSQLKGIYKVPLDILLPKLNVDEKIIDAVIKKEGHLGKILMLVEAVEALETDRISELLQGLKMPVERFHELVRLSYEWVAENVSQLES